MREPEKMKLKENALKNSEEKENSFFPDNLNPNEYSVQKSSEPSDNSDKKKEFKSNDPELFAFQKEFQEESTLEIKLQKALAFMEKALSSNHIPHFRHFWDARALCLPLFKESLSPLIRSQGWNKYCELSKEARRLKELLDEQSSFASEQIEIAIKALEAAIEIPEDQLENLGEDFIIPKVLQEKKEFYELIQRQLNVLNAQASHINALRKELLKTDMRIRQKNKFFQRLSVAGDKVFPKRKELIKDVSHQFIEDVNCFVNAHFSENSKDTALFILRDDIKSLQALAKILTLNTHAFTETRTQLSQCWDQIKVKDKEQKKERANQKVAFKENSTVIQQKINALKETLENGNLSSNDKNKKIEEIQNEMRKIELGRDEVNSLRQQLSQIKASLQGKIQSEEKLKQKEEEERLKKKREVFDDLKAQADHLIKKYDDLDADALIAQKDQIANQIELASLTKNEKHELERALKILKDLIVEKKEKALLNLSDDDRQNLNQLQELLQKRKARRIEIKNQLENLRKLAGISGLDFEKAMNYNTLIAEEKERFEKSALSIKEIENKIIELKSKI